MRDVREAVRVAEEVGTRLGKRPLLQRSLPRGWEKVSAPKRCASLAEVRAEIDRLDRALVPLLVERGAYVRQAAAFKTDPGHVAAPDRVERVIAAVRALAAAEGGDPDVIEAIYRPMIAAYIADELALWSEHRA